MALLPTMLHALVGLSAITATFGTQILDHNMIYEEVGVLTSASYHEEYAKGSTFNLIPLLPTRSNAERSSAEISNAEGSSAEGSSEEGSSEEGSSAEGSNSLRYYGGTCGAPHPKCTTGCFDKGECVCHLPTGQYTYNIYPCKENAKICAKGRHKYFDYSKIHPQHSAALPPNDQCQKIRQGVTENEKHQILQMHNNFRAKVARGQEHRSPQPGVSQPSGSNIKELAWNDELAYIAQKWADQCNYRHESPNTRREPCSKLYDYVGQNLYKAWGALSGTRWPQAITSWYDEVADTPTSLVKQFKLGVTTKKIGHYTQMMWANTYEIGCGAVEYPGSSFGYGSTQIYVCNYGPGGNIIGDELYNVGRAASECGASGKSRKYSGLCAAKK